MAQRISGRDVAVTLANGIRVRFEQVNLNAELGVAGVTSNGRPDGWVKGANSADGDIQITPEELLKINEAVAESDGASWESFPAFPMSFVAQVGDTDFNVTAFGVKLNAPDFKFNGEGGEKIVHTLKFMITDPNFILLNGVRLADAPLTV